jgi:hypothetical protein
VSIPYNVLRDIAVNTSEEKVLVENLELTADQVDLNTDTLEALLTSIAGYTDGIETLLGRLPAGGSATEATLATASGTLTAIAGYTDGIETLLGRLPAAGAASAAKQDALATALTDGTARVGGTVAVSGPLTDAQIRASAIAVDSELPAGVLLSDTLANPTAPAVAAYSLMWDNSGTQWVRMGNAASAVDGGGGVGTQRVHGVLYNGATYDKTRSASAADGTVGTGLLGVAKLLWDSGTSTYVRQGNARAAADGADGSASARVHALIFNGTTFDRVRGLDGFQQMASGSKTTTGSLTALNDAVTVDCAAYRWVSVELVGAGGWNSTWNFEVSDDNTNWVAIHLAQVGNATFPNASAGTNAGPIIYNGAVAARYFRVRCSAYTAGTMAVTVFAGQATPTTAVGTPSDGMTTPTVSWQSSFGNIYNGATWDRMRSAASANNTTGTGLLGIAALVWDGTNYRRWSAASDGADGLTGGTVASVTPRIYNGTTFDRARGIDGFQQVASGSKTASGTLNATDAQVAIDCDGYRWVSVQVVPTAITGHNYQFECSNDSTDGTNGNWYAMGLVDASSGQTSILSASSTASTRVWHGPVAARWFRVRLNPYGSGSTVVTVRASSLPGGTPTVQLAGNVGTGDAIASLTLPGVTAFGRVYNGTNWDNVRSASAAEGTTGRGAPGAGLMVFDGTNYRRLLGASTTSDSAGGQTAAMVSPRLWNGASYDREYSNIAGTALASAARTGTASSATLTNYNGRGVVVFLDVTAASGTGGLTISVRGVDPTSGNSTPIATSTTAVLATGTYPMVIYPGASGVSGGTGPAQGMVSAPVPRSFIVRVTHGDASSYTYSAGYSLVN